MTLFIVATPIGNLEDITLRALRVLKEADLILAEDTRRTKILLKHFDITTSIESFHDHNKEQKTPHVINQLQQNKNIALVSDAGTPAIADPGFFLVREARKSNITVVPVPGPNAAITALCAAGLPTDKFCFYGFLSKKQGKAEQTLKEIKSRKETAIIYESPHRIEKTIKKIAEIMPDADVVAARELTKTFEEFVCAKAKYIKVKSKGEFVILIAPQV